MNINEWEIKIKPLLDEDIVIFEKWLDKEYIKKWFGNKNGWLKEINGRKDEFNYVKHFIVYHNNTKIGFCQYFDGYFAREVYNDITEKNYAYEVNYLIGEEEYLNKGIGKLIIKIMEGKIKEIGGKILLADPESENIISQKTLLSNGFIKNNDGDYRKLL
jgi:RimJ/RimL family protein N-acetyltransferase